MHVPHGDERALVDDEGQSAVVLISTDVDLGEGVSVPPVAVPQGVPQGLGLHGSDPAVGAETEERVDLRATEVIEPLEFRAVERAVLMEDHHEEVESVSFRRGRGVESHENVLLDPQRLSRSS